MKIHPASQGSLEWMTARAGVITASEFDQIVTPEFAIRKGEMPRSYLARKLAERWIGGPLPGFSTWDTDQGHMLEDKARPFYTMETGEDIESVGLITTDDGMIGCSPDGLIGSDSGIEIKCPEAHTHVRYLMAGSVPKEYIAQVHGTMFVTGRPRWVFLSYRRKFPPLIVRVERDDEIQEKLAEALSGFVTQLQYEYERLVELNGGEPERAPEMGRVPEWLDPARTKHEPQDFNP